MAILDNGHFRPWWRYHFRASTCPIHGLVTGAEMVRKHRVQCCKGRQNKIPPSRSSMPLWHCIFELKQRYRMQQRRSKENFKNNMWEGCAIISLQPTIHWTFRHSCLFLVGFVSLFVHQNCASQLRNVKEKTVARRNPIIFWNCLAFTFFKKNCRRCYKYIALFVRCMHIFKVSCKQKTEQTQAPVKTSGIYNCCPQTAHIFLNTRTPGKMRLDFCFPLNALVGQKCILI